ncbi:MAG: PilZ domain-containing protein [Pseudomonadota bacterium]
MFKHTPSRQYPRVPVDVVVSELDGDQACAVRGRDISTTGLYVDALQGSLLEREQLSVEFCLPGDDEPVWALCDVVRDDRVGAHDGHALRFARLAEQDRLRIAHYVRSYFEPVARPVARIQTVQRAASTARNIFLFRAVGEILC